MRPAEIKDKEIIQAGEDLQKAGRTITGFALRQKTGGGNPARLKQVWDEHAAGQHAADSTPVAELPHEIAEASRGLLADLAQQFERMVLEINTTSVNAAERRVAEVLKTAAAQREQMSREIEDASSTVDDLESKLEAELQIRSSLQVKHDESQTLAQQQAVAIAQLKERLAAAEEDLDQANISLKSLEAVRSQVSELAGRLAEAQDVNARLIGRA